MYYVINSVQIFTPKFVTSTNNQSDIIFETEIHLKWYYILKIKKTMNHLHKNEMFIFTWCILYSVITYLMFVPMRPRDTTCILLNITLITLKYLCVLTLYFLIPISSNRNIVYYRGSSFD